MTRNGDLNHGESGERKRRAELLCSVNCDNCQDERDVLSPND